MYSSAHTLICYFGTDAWLDFVYFLFSILMSRLAVEAFHLHHSNIIRSMFKKNCSLEEAQN